MTSTIRENKSQALFKASCLSPPMPPCRGGKSPFLKACHTFLSFQRAVSNIPRVGGRLARERSCTRQVAWGDGCLLLAPPELLFGRGTCCGSSFWASGWTGHDGRGSGMLEGSPESIRDNLCALDVVPERSRCWWGCSQIRWGRTVFAHFQCVADGNFL